MLGSRIKGQDKILCLVKKYLARYRVTLIYNVYVLELKSSQLSGVTLGLRLGPSIPTTEQVQFGVTLPMLNAARGMRNPGAVAESQGSVENHY